MSAANQNRETTTFFFDVFLQSFFTFSMPPKVIIIVTQFMFLGINIFWALLRAHFNPRLTSRTKMSLSRAKNIFMQANINSIVLFYGGAPDMDFISCIFLLHLYRGFYILQARVE